MNISKYSVYVRSHSAECQKKPTWGAHGWVGGQVFGGEGWQQVCQYARMYTSVYARACVLVCVPCVLV